MRKGFIPGPALSAARIVCQVTAALLIAAGASAQIRSAVHALAAEPVPAGRDTRAIYNQGPPEPLGLAVTGKDWSAYSRGVNRINACSTRGSETWLATDIGVKIVDRSRHLVTHLTQLDGLPDNRVLAIATTADSAWSVVATKHAEAQTADLCEYQQTDKRWHALRSIPRPLVPIVSTNGGAYSPGAPLENSLVAACPEKVCFATSPIRAADRILALCFDRRLKLWDEIPALPEFTLDPTALSITWLDIDRDGLWAATTAGLLRYQFRDKHWTRYLRDRMVYAAVKPSDGTIWAATYVRSTAPIDRSTPAADTNAVSGHWFVSHFTPKSNQAVHFQAPDTANRMSAYGIRQPVTYSGISLSGGSVWLTPGSRYPIGAQIPYLRLDLHDTSWRSYSAQQPNEIDSVPDVALEQQSLPRSTLHSGLYPWRLREWVCRDAIEDSVEGAPRNPQVSKDTDGTTWATDGRGLTQTDERGAVLHRFGLSHVSIPVTPPVSAVTVANGRLYAASSGDVQAFDLSAGAWSRVRLPRSQWSNPADERLIPDGDRVWISTPATAYRYDPATQQFSVEYTTQNGGFHLLGALAGQTWLRGPDSLLYKADPVTGEPESVDVPQLPPAITAAYERPSPFGLEAGILWFRLINKKEPDKLLFVGYHLGKKAWTTEYAVKKPNQMAPACISAGNIVYFPVSDDSGAVACYDAGTDKWSFAASKPAGNDLPNFSVISVDAGDIWILDGGRRIMCFHRSDRTWSAQELPQGLWVQQYGNEAVRNGNSIFLATNAGVWEYQIANQQWKELPGIASREIYLSTISLDSRAVWSIGRSPNGNQAFAMRFDKSSHQWSYWTDKDGFPERGYPPNVVLDGTSAWVVAQNYCYHLDPATNRWENVSARMGQRTGSAKGVITIKAAASDRAFWVPVTAIEPNGDAVWILPAVRGAKSADGSPAPLLVRYDRSSARFDYLDPGAELGLTVAGGMLQVDFSAVWVPTPSGVFRLDKSTIGWRRVEPPASAGSWGKFSTQRVLESGATLTFYGADSAIRWTK